MKGRPTINPNKSMKYIMNSPHEHQRAQAVIELPKIQQHQKFCCLFQEKWPMHTDALDQHWGMFHEIGHNVQRKDWTFEGYTECTVNIFSMFQMEFLAKVGQFCAITYRILLIIDFSVDQMCCLLSSSL